MKKSLTRREKIFLLILVAVLLSAGYFNLFLLPVKARLLAAREQLERVQSELAKEQVKAERIKRMQVELNALEDSNAFQPSIVPNYDNIDAVMIQLDEILSTATDYRLSFSDVNEGDILVTRSINLTFTAKDYSSAKIILDKLYRCRYRCTLQGITVAVAEENTDQEDITSQKNLVSLTVNFYEKKTDQGRKKTIDSQNEEE